MLNHSQYNLFDISILNSPKAVDFCIWQPKQKYIVLGRANKAEDAVFVEKAKNDNIEILIRPSGGGTVILTPHTLVIALKISVKTGLNVHKYFRIINSQIILALSKLGIDKLSLKGISDIAINDKKILGSSMYKRKDAIFYHAVLNISEPVETIEEYLKYPDREPDYRNGRSHINFVTSIRDENYNLQQNQISESINERLLEFEYSGLK